MLGGAGQSQLDVGSAERGLTALVEAAERAVEKISSSVPPAQLRALLIIDRVGSLNLNRLAAQVGASASATSRLCDRMEVAGLLTRDRAVGSRREIVLLLTESGRRLAGVGPRPAPRGPGRAAPGDEPGGPRRAGPRAGRARRRGWLTRVAGLAELASAWQAGLALLSS